MVGKPDAIQKRASRKVRTNARPAGKSQLAMPEARDFDRIAFALCDP